MSDWPPERSRSSNPPPAPISPTSPTLAEQAKAFRNEREQARDERITTFRKAEGDLDQDTMDSMREEITQRAQAIGTIRSDGPNGSADANSMRNKIDRYGTDAYAEFERKVTADEIVKAMPKELRQAERLEQLRAQQRAQNALTNDHARER